MHSELINKALAWVDAHILEQGCLVEYGWLDWTKMSMSNKKRIGFCTFLIYFEYLKGWEGSRLKLVYAEKN